jgi:hypothetical protein
MRAAAILLLLSVGWTQSALGQDTAKWGQVGGWQIRVDRSVGDGCFAVQAFDGGTIVRIGFDAAAQKIYVFFGDDDWKSIEVGKIYPVRVVFDGVSAFNGEMKGLSIGKTVFLAHTDLSTDFVKNFMQRNGMQIFYRGSQIAHLSLRNTFAAVGEVINCQREIGGNPGTSNRDPFVSTPPRQNRDPFR